MNRSVPCPACIKNYIVCALCVPRECALLKIVAPHVAVTYNMPWCYETVVQPMFCSLNSGWPDENSFKLSGHPLITCIIIPLKYFYHKLLQQCMCADQRINIPIPIPIQLKVMPRTVKSNIHWKWCQERIKVIVNWQWWPKQLFKSNFLLKVLCWQ